jgi:Kinesin motor domain
VQQSLSGYNGCVFVYGQTGAGKTHTMVGSQDQPGVLPRALEYLYEQIALDLQHNSTTEYLVKCSYLEIYNEHIIDLVCESPYIFS